MRLIITVMVTLSLFVSCSKDDSASSVEIEEIDNSGQDDDGNIDDNDGGGQGTDDGNTDDNDGGGQGTDGGNTDDNDGGGQGTDDNPDQVLTTEQERLKDEFIFRAFKKSKSRPNENVRKWNSDIKILLSGNFSSEEFNIIQNFVNEIRNLNNGFDITIANNSNDYNAEFYKSTAQEYLNIRPDFIAGFSPTGVYSSAVSNVSVLVANDEINSGQIWLENPIEIFEHAVKREFLRLLGIGDTEDSSSLIFKFSNTSVTELNSDDMFVIKTLLNPLIESGFTEDEVKETIQNNKDSFF